MTDPELTRSSVQVLRKRAKQSDLRVADYRRTLVERIVQRMLGDRFGELARKPDAKFLGASASDQSISRAVDAFVLAAGVQDGKIDDGVAALAVETKRAREFGFSASEIDRAKKSIAAFYEQIYAEREKSESGSFAQELLNLFLEDEPAPGIEYEYRLVKQILPAITTEEVLAMARTLMADEGRVVLAVAPQKDGLQPPTEAGLRAALGSADATAVTAWSDTSTTRALVETKPRPATIVSRREIPEIGVTVVRLSNGVEAWLKPTTFKNDQILFSLTSPGGASLATPDAFEEAALASNYVRRLGRGRFEGARSGENAGRQAGERKPLDLAVEPRHFGERGARRSRNRAPAALPGFRGARRRSRAARRPEAAADRRGGQSRAGARTGVQRAPRAGQHLEPLHVAAVDGRAHRGPRSAEDGGVLPRALLERGRLHVFHGRRLQD